MACKNSYLMIILVSIIIYLIISKPTNTEYMDNVQEDQSDSKQIPISKLTYGGVSLQYNNDPSDSSYGYINAANDMLYVPNADVLINKNLYLYSPMVSIKKEHTEHQVEVERKISDLVDNTYYSDDIMSKAISHNLYSNGVINHFNTETEDYFD